MPIKYIFNGYYRSGTTLIWEILKTSNPDYVVFYEPLHPQLSMVLKKYFHAKDKIDKLHGKELWEEYFEKGKPFIKERERNHTFSKFIYPMNYRQLFNYIDVYQKLQENTILQTNRLHFHLKDAVKKYKIKAFHIIRNPIDVYNSLMVYYKNYAKWYMEIASYIKNRHSPRSNTLKIKKNIEYTFCNYGIPPYWGEKKKKLRILRRPFATHLLSWILSNYFAIKDYKNSNIDIVIYEKLLSYPEKVQNMITSTTDLAFNILPVKRKKIEMEVYKSPQIVKTIELIGMKDEFNYILEAIMNSKN